VGKLLGENGRALAAQALPYALAGAGVIGVATGVISAYNNFTQPGGDPLAGVLDLLQAAAGLYSVARFLGSACFRAGTPLLTPDGDMQIERFRRGDLILTRSEWDSNGPLEVKRVLRTFTTLARVLELRVHGRVIATTARHPFCVRGLGWTAAEELRPGDVLVSDDGQRVLVEGVWDTGRWEPVYNLMVEDYHTYFVGARDWGFSVWAHNQCQAFVDRLVRAGMKRQTARVQYYKILKRAGADPAAREAAFRNYLSTKLPSNQLAKAVREAMAPERALPPGQRRLRAGQGFVADPNNPPSPYKYTDAQRRADWRRLATDPNAPLTTAQRAQIMERGWRGPQRVNAQGQIETMELSHEPIPLRDGGTNVVPRWPRDHAAIDEFRQLRR
jgi:hypothetical protein